MRPDHPRSDWLAARWTRAALIVFLLIPLRIDAGTPEPPVDPLRAEKHRRNDALVKEGFNLTRGLDLEAAPDKRMRGELLVAPSNDEHLLSLLGRSAQRHRVLPARRPEGHGPGRLERAHG